MRKESLDTRWEGSDLLVLRDEREIDRIPASDIRRVILACRGGDAPSDLRFAIVQTDTEHILLPAASGIAGRVHFERQSFWMQRACVYWVDEASAPLPRRLLSGAWLLRRQPPGWKRLPLAELSSLIEQWPLDGPHTWEQRKWAQIARNRSLPTAESIRTQPPRR